MHGWDGSFSMLFYFLTSVLKVSFIACWLTKLVNIIETKNASALPYTAHVTDCFQYARFNNVYASG